MLEDSKVHTEKAEAAPATEKLRDSSLIRVPGGTGCAETEIWKRDGFVTATISKACDNIRKAEKRMNFKKKDKRQIHLLKLDDIRPNPYQPRKKFNPKALTELSESIKVYGVIQPISVRKTANEKYEIIAGERRYRASLMAGLEMIPAITIQAGENDSALMALIENIQRENISYIEEAEAYQNILNSTDMTQEELAQQLGKSQSTVANKLRLLRLSEEVRREISRYDLSERHARALLKIRDEQVQKRILNVVCSKNLTVKKTEELVEKVHSKCIGAAIERSEIDRRVSRVVKDVRIFVNTIRKSVQMLREAGIDARSAQFDRGDYTEFVIRIPKKHTVTNERMFGQKLGDHIQNIQSVGEEKVS